MAHKLYAITIRWIKTPLNYVLIDNILGANGDDWMRLNAYFWLLWSVKSPTEIRDALKARLHPDDSIFVIATNPNVSDGWAPKWAWDWVQAKRDLFNRSV